jgi:ParB family chromosome partitioning protein
MGDIEGLARSMNEIGLLHPVAIDADYRLIAGERRILAAKMLGWQAIEAHFVDLENLLQGEHDENVERKGFTPSEAVEIGRALEDIERAKARERMAVRSGNLPEVNASDKGNAIDRVASAVGMSRHTYEKAQDVVEAAEQDPIFEPIAQKMDETGNVSGAWKELEQARRPHVANNGGDNEW